MLNEKKTFDDPLNRVQDKTGKCEVGQGPLSRAGCFAIRPFRCLRRPHKHEKPERIPVMVLKK